LMALANIVLVHESKEEPSNVRFIGAKN
jgi:hypothetical protein